MGGIPGYKGKEYKYGGVSRWAPPPTDVLKANVDAAFRADTGERGWGLVVRDETGDMIMAAAGKLVN